MKTGRFESADVAFADVASGPRPFTFGSPMLLGPSGIRSQFGPSKRQKPVSRPSLPHIHLPESWVDHSTTTCDRRRRTTTMPERSVDLPPPARRATPVYLIKNKLQVHIFASPSYSVGSERSPKIHSESLKFYLSDDASNHGTLLGGSS
jgi:hypothetical protein